MATRITPAGAITGLLATLLMGCSDGSDGGDGPLAASDFIPAAATGICADLGDCCEQDQHPFSAESCRETYTDALEERLARDTVTYDADAGGRCVRALRSSPASCDVTAAEFEACNDVFRGTIPIGGTCVEGPDCVGFPDAALCVPAGASGDQQVCTAIYPAQQPIRASQGEACAATCRPDTPYTCNSFGPEPVNGCYTDDGLYCSQTTGTCAPLIPEGGACALAERNGCAPGSFCDRGACIAVRAESESCIVDACAPAFGCASPSDDACRAGLVCNSGATEPLCVAPQPDGSSCTSFRECASGWCELECDDASCASPGYCDRPKRSTRDQCAGTTSSAAPAVSSVATALGLP